MLVRFLVADVQQQTKEVWFGYIESLSKQVVFLAMCEKDIRSLDDALQVSKNRKLGEREEKKKTEKKASEI